MTDSLPSATVTSVDADELVDARVSPTGSLENLSQREVAQLLSSEHSEVYALFRRCALAVLTSGSIADDPRLLFERYRDFDIRLGRQVWGIRLDLKNAPPSAFV